MHVNRHIFLAGLAIIAMTHFLACSEQGLDPELNGFDTSDTGTTGTTGANTDNGDNGGGTSGDGTTGNDTEGGETCANSNFEIEGQKVDMLIVLDRSNSMKDDGLWGPMGTALTEVTAKMNQQINFGLLLFPNLLCNGNFAQCDAPTNVRVPIGDANAAKKIAYNVSPQNGVGTCGGTPTAKTLITALRTLTNVNGDNDRYVLLATDGGPNCNDFLNCSTCTSTMPDDSCKDPNLCLDDTSTIDAARSLSNEGYPVYVLGMGGSSKWSSVMNSIAQAGGTGSYFAVDNTNDLLQTLNSITGKVMSCKFDVDWNALPEGTSKDRSKVNFYCKQTKSEPENDKNRIGFDQDCASGTGWNWVDDNTVEFCQSACDNLKNDGCPVVTATFGCESVSVPIV